MAELSDSQAVILGAACQRADRSIFPLSKTLKGNAAGNVLKSLLKKGLIEEVRAKRDDTVWRQDENRGRLTLRATRAAFEALGMEPAEASEEDAPAGADGAPKANAATSVPAAANGALAAPKTRRGGKMRAAGKGLTKQNSSSRTRADSKQARLIEMLKRPQGATIEEIAKKFDWQAHTVRGAIAGALKKKLGLEVTSEKDESRGRVYRIAG